MAETVVAARGTSRWKGLMACSREKSSTRWSLWRLCKERDRAEI